MGSAAYVRTHREEVSTRGRCMYNLDSYGSHLGWLQLYINAHADFEASVRPHFRALDLRYQTVTSVVPYADHFPFVAAGLPGVFHYRVNCDGGRFFHHRPDDDLTRVSPQVIARDVSAVATWLDDMARVDTLPFTPSIPDEQRAERRVVLGGPLRRVARALMNAAHRLRGRRYRSSWRPRGPIQSHRMDRGTWLKVAAATSVSALMPARGVTDVVAVATREALGGRLYSLIQTDGYSVVARLARAVGR